MALDPPTHFQFILDGWIFLTLQHPLVALMYVLTKLLQIQVIFSHLRLCLATAIHNLK